MKLNLVKILFLNSYATSKNVRKSDSFQSELASFIISSRLARSNAIQLFKILKSVDSLECLKSLPMDSRTLLSTTRSGDIDISTIISSQYINFGIISGLTHLYNIDSCVRQLAVFELPMV